MSNSRCMRVFFETPEQRESFTNKLVGLMRNLREQHHLERFFFNRYTNPSENEYFLQMGFFNYDDDLEEGLENLLNTNTHENVDPYDCETSDVGGISIEELKCCSVEMYEVIQRYFNGKPSIDQMGFILHFFMNQLSYGYEEESWIYLLAVQRIVSTLARR